MRNCMKIKAFSIFGVNVLEFPSPAIKHDNSTSVTEAGEIMVNKWTFNFALRYFSSGRFSLRKIG